VDVLEGDGDARERPEGPLADLLVGPPGPLEGVLPHDRRERADPLLHGIDALEDIRDDLRGRHFLFPDQILQLVYGQFIQSHSDLPCSFLFA